MQQKVHIIWRKSDPHIYFVTRLAKYEARTQTMTLV